MEEKEYLDNRLEKQIEWYDKKSKSNQIRFRVLVIVEIVASVSIPFLNSFDSEELPIIKVLIGLTGILIALIAGLLNLFKFHENWIHYRATAESLKHQKYLYLSKSGVYKAKNIEETSFNLFVSSIESIISKENSIWQQNINNPKKS